MVYSDTRRQSISVQSLVDTLLQSIGQVVVLEAEQGRSRTELLQQALQTAQAAGAKTWFLSCQVTMDGLWAGLNQWLQSLLPAIEKTAPHLIKKHSYELAMVLPALRRTIQVSNPNLTDSSTGEERVRNYPIDRAYRIVHGLIDMLDAWYEYGDGAPWVIVCDDYDQAGFLVRRFFAELIRRRGKRLNLTLLTAVKPGACEDTMVHLKPQFLAQTIRVDLPVDPAEPVSGATMRQLAEQVEQQIGRDLIEAEILGARVITYWLQSDQPEKALIWQSRILGLYNHQGFYEDALVYCDAVAPQLERLCGDDEAFHWNSIGNLFNCYAATGKIQKAFEAVQEALLKLKGASQMIRANYLMSMMYARFLPDRDFAKAEEYLQRSLNILENADIPEDEKHFLTAFDMNGLALVRHRQKRTTEAIELCQAGIDRLNAHLRVDQHRLHRSVLHYNIAQVYAAVGELETAVTYFTDAMDADPNYSEYYNERGNAYQRMGRLDEAISDYQKAIELSPPYYEVWMNLGQCYQAKGLLQETIDAYSVALDLSPEQTSAYLARAQALEELGQFHAALADYDAVLQLEPDQPFVFANRATLYYELEEPSQALENLNQAIALLPDNPDFYQNRAIILIGLGRSDEAAQDLQMYLQLNPNAEDLLEIQNSLLELEKA